MTPTPETVRVTVRSPADLIAAVPYLLGFHPRDSVVVVALRRRQLIFGARADLPAPDTPDDQRESLARYIVSVVIAQGGDAATIIGYGPLDAVEMIVPAVRQSLAEHHLPLLEVLRVHKGRYWSCLCADPRCCPREGFRFDAATSVIAATATYAGRLALPDRASLVRMVTPVVGEARAAMRRATDLASARLADLLARTSGTDTTRDQAVCLAGEAAVGSLLNRASRGGVVADEHAAWAIVLLARQPVRDFAWRHIGDQDWQVDLWSDLVRRAEPGLVAAPASLLAFAAWRVGNGALANIALDQALTDDPEYSMARLLRDALDQGLPPSALADWPWPAGRPHPRGRPAQRRGANRRRSPGH